MTMLLPRLGLHGGVRVKPLKGEGERIPDACAVVALANVKGNLISGSVVVSMLNSMKPRYNGLGAGFAVYGIYPDFESSYTLHLMFENVESKRGFEELLAKGFRVEYEEEIPTRSVIESHPILWRYFLKSYSGDAFKDRIFRLVMFVNSELDGVYVMSSGRNMAVFKGLGYPEDVAEFYRIGDYKGFAWLGHGRYPTNSPGWWGGSHPFNVLNTSIVHNGELSSYDVNRRYLEHKGYRCVFLTDSEILSYSLDYLLRVEGLGLQYACKVLAPPFWTELEDPGKEILRLLRLRYSDLLMNGPFSIAAVTEYGNRLYLLGLTDRVKLRPLIAAVSGDLFILSSEECGVRGSGFKPDRVWMLEAGIPVYVGIDTVEA